MITIIIQIITFLIGIGVFGFLISLGQRKTWEAINEPLDGAIDIQLETIKNLQEELTHLKMRPPGPPPPPSGPQTFLEMRPLSDRMVLNTEIPIEEVIAQIDKELNEEAERNNLPQPKVEEPAPMMIKTVDTLSKEEVEKLKQNWLAEYYRQSATPYMVLNNTGCSKCDCEANTYWRI